MSIQSYRALTQPPTLAAALLGELTQLKRPACPAWLAWSPLCRATFARQACELARAEGLALPGGLAAWLAFWAGQLRRPQGAPPA